MNGGRRARPMRAPRKMASRLPSYAAPARMCFASSGPISAAIYPAVSSMASEQKGPQGGRFDLRALLRPHLPALALAFVASLGETIANLSEPWPIKIVLD